MIPPPPRRPRFQNMPTSRLVESKTSDFPSAHVIGFGESTSYLGDGAVRSQSLWRGVGRRKSQ